MLHLIAVVSSEDFGDSEVAQAVEVQLAAVLGVPEVVLAAEVATPEVASLFLQGFEHWFTDKAHYRTPAALRMEANRTPDLVLLDSLANTQVDLKDFGLVLVPAVGPALPALEELEPEELVEVEQGVVAIVGPLEFDFAVDFVALGQPFVVALVEFVVGFGIVEGTFGYFVEQVSGLEGLD